MELLRNSSPLESLHCEGKGKARCGGTDRVGEGARFEVPKGLAKEEQRGATVFASSLEAPVASSVSVERQTDKNPVLSSIIYVKRRATVDLKLLKRKG